MSSENSHSRLTLKDAIALAKKEGAGSVVRGVYERAKKLNPKVNAYLRFDAVQPEAAEGKGELAGVPIAVKDNICIQNKEVTCASKILKGHIAPYDATVITKLKNAGASLLGQCNMDEFAFGSSSETSAYGAVRNPWNLDYVPGGSSGGSAAAVAADMAIAALGSDTGGSIRQPAALCGVVGLKPTYGRVSRFGLVAFGSSFDQIGPITKTVEDAAILLRVISGFDEKDSTSAPQAVPDFAKALTGDVRGLRVGIPKEYYVDGLNPEIAAGTQHAVEILKQKGAQVKPVSLPHTPYSVCVYYIVAVAEASSNLGRFDGVEYGLRASNENLRELYFQTRDQGFGKEAKRRILLGTFVLSSGYYDAFYLKGQKVRTLIRRDFENVFKEVDVLAGPTSPTPAFKIGEKTTDPLAMYLSDIFTIPANLAGIPAISVPCGFTKAGLPIGFQIMGRYFEEAAILNAAFTVEQSLGIYQKKPGISA